MKRVSFFMMASIAIAMTSCTKELASDSVSSSASELAVPGTITTPKLSLSANTMNYGAWVLSPYESTDTAGFGFVMDVAGSLGLPCLRDITPVPGVKKVKTLSTQYNVLLNFLSNKPKPMIFRTDTTAYKADLESTLAALCGNPTMAIIENEESNKGYYSGSALDYIKQLKAAITVMHSHGIPVTNGGLTSVGLKYLVYQDYVSRGMTTQANDYKKRMGIAVNNADTKDRGTYESVLISNYAKMNLDYVNFHWRSSTAADAQGLGETIDYLQRATGKKVITTEIGQYDQDPATLTATVNMCKSYNFPYIIWYSGNEDHRSYPLQFDNESLTQTGFTYRDLVASK